MLKTPLAECQYLRPKVRGYMAQGKTVSLHPREQDPFFAPIFRPFCSTAWKPLPRRTAGRQQLRLRCCPSLFPGGNRHCARQNIGGPNNERPEGQQVRNPLPREDRSGMAMLLAPFWNFPVAITNI